MGQLRRFSLREVHIATDNFNDNNTIGQGGFGKVYRGILPDQTMVAVKQLGDYHSLGGEAAFLREVQLISVAVHRNQVQLIGFCTTPTERILVYPFMRNLSVLQSNKISTWLKTLFIYLLFSFSRVAAIGTRTSSCLLWAFFLSS